MTRLTKTHFFTALVVLSTIFFSSSCLAADYPLKEKLLQCEAAFEKMHSGKLSQEEAWKVRLEHKKLVRELLEHLNTRNHNILKSEDYTMSSEEVLDNFIVMGSLLEMLATENLRITDEWGFPLTH